jgi:hypothetical protein
MAPSGGRSGPPGRKCRPSIQHALRIGTVLRRRRPRDRLVRPCLSGAACTAWWAWKLPGNSRPWASIPTRSSRPSWARSPCENAPQRHTHVLAATRIRPPTSPRRLTRLPSIHRAVITAPGPGGLAICDATKSSATRTPSRRSACPATTVPSRSSRATGIYGSADNHARLELPPFGMTSARNAACVHVHRG